MPKIFRGDMKDEDGVAGPGGLAEIPKPLIPAFSGRFRFVDTLLKENG